MKIFSTRGTLTKTTPPGKKKQRRQPLPNVVNIYISYRPPSGALRSHKHCPLSVGS